MPRVQVETTDTTTNRHVLAAAEASARRLTIRVQAGQFFADASAQPLTLTRAGEFVYLSSTEPGKYIRVRRVNDRLTYVEHVDQGTRSVTYWGELRVVLGR
jgi:hypothetical protein